MAKGMKKKNKIVKNEEIKEEAELNNKKVKKHKKFNVKKNLGRLIALIVVSRINGWEWFNVTIHS